MLQSIFVKVHSFLFRWSLVIDFVKKGLRVCSRNRHEDQGDWFALYEKLIEALVKSKRYEEALEKFQKIKKFNLNSMKAADVDTEVGCSNIS